MKLGNATIGKLARMICGDEPYNTVFPYRSSSYLTSFFEETELDYVHDGSTRYWWVRSVILDLNELEEASENLPSNELVRVITYLVDPDHFDGDVQKKQKHAIEVINESLKRYDLLIERDDRTGNVKLCISNESYVSTAVAQNIVRRTITFSPAVFSVPEKDPDPKLVAVMMPFAAEFSLVYEAIGHACDDAGLIFYRADDIWEESTFIQDIFNLIFQSSIVIVDFTNRNPNVMYETGLSHALGKDVVPLTQHLADIPSDLKPHRALEYLPNAEGLQELRSKLAARLKTLHERHQ